jgi:hypothetical protein
VLVKRMRGGVLKNRHDPQQYGRQGCCASHLCGGINQNEHRHRCRIGRCRWSQKNDAALTSPPFCAFSLGCVQTTYRLVGETVISGWLPARDRAKTSLKALAAFF